MGWGSKVARHNSLVWLFEETILEAAPWFRICRSPIHVDLVVLRLQWLSYQSIQIIFLYRGRFYWHSLILFCLLFAEAITFVTCTLLPCVNNLIAIFLISSVGEHARDYRQFGGFPLFWHQDGADLLRQIIVNVMRKKSIELRPCFIWTHAFKFRRDRHMPIPRVFSGAIQVAELVDWSDDTWTIFVSWHFFNLSNSKKCLAPERRIAFHRLRATAKTPFGSLLGIG